MTDKPELNARVIDAERDTAFAEQARRCPGFAGHRSRTERVIPVIALIPLGEGAGSADGAERTRPPADS